MKKLLILLLIIIIPLKVNAFNLGKSAILMEEDTKRILVSKNINNKMLIASTTKIMTAIVAIENGNLNKMITVSDKVLESYGSNVYLKVGEKISVEDMLYGLLMQSGNDCAILISEYYGGDEYFVKLMNEKAKKIGMINTSFYNPTGLDEKTKNISTAYDMALLMRYAVNNKKFVKITSTKKHNVKTNLNYYEWVNKNKLLYSYPYVYSGKTGYTKQAKRTLVTAAKKDNLNLIVVTLNDPNDFANHKKLYEYGFNNYKMIKVFDKKKIKNKKYYAKDDFYYPITNKEKELITIDYKLSNKKYKKDELAGYALVKLSSKIIHKENIYYK